MTRRTFTLASAAAITVGYQPLRWKRYESWQQHRRSLHTAFLRGYRSDGAVFTVAAVSEPGCFDRLQRSLDDYLRYPMACGDAFAGGKASGYRL